MNKIEKPLSFLLITAAIVFAFAYNQKGNDYMKIENNQNTGYNVNSAESSYGYFVSTPPTCKVTKSEVSDNGSVNVIVSAILDSMWTEKDSIEIIIEGKEGNIEVNSLTQEKL